jgi:type I restriction enzyme, S subunit
VSWPTVPLEDCARIVSGATPSTAIPDFWDGDIGWATPKDLSELDGRMISDTPRKITAAGLASCAAEILPAGSVLFSSRAPIGHVAINQIPLATNQGFKSFIPDRQKLDAGYLYWWLRQNRSYLEGIGNGATFKEVSKAVIGRVNVPLPPLSEQRRIAAILDQADDLRRKHAKALSYLDRLAESVFLDLFGDPHRTPKGWDDRHILGDAAEIVSGVTIGRNLAGQRTRIVPYLAVINVQDRSLNLDPVKNTEATEEEIARYRLRPGDLLLTEGGDPDKLGRGTLWNGELETCIHQNHIFRVRLNTNAVDPVFLNRLVGSQRGKRYFLRSAKQTTGIASINMRQLRGFPLLIPPISVQREFRSRLAEIEAGKRACQDHLAKLDALFAALQHRAFRGEL